MLQCAIYSCTVITDKFIVFYKSCMYKVVNTLSKIKSALKPDPVKYRAKDIYHSRDNVTRAQRRYNFYNNK